MECPPSHRVSIPPRKSCLDTSGGTKSADSFAGSRLVFFSSFVRHLPCPPPHPSFPIHNHALIPFSSLQINDFVPRCGMFVPTAREFIPPPAEPMGRNFAYFARSKLDFSGIVLVPSGQKKLFSMTWDDLVPPTLSPFSRPTNPFPSRLYCRSPLSQTDSCP